MPTTSRPPRRTSKASAPQSPLKRIQLTVTLIGGAAEWLESAAAEKGLTVDKRGANISLTFAAATAEEALERLRLLSELVASKG